jgi:hypothetical protein
MPEPGEHVLNEAACSLLHGYNKCEQVFAMVVATLEEAMCSPLNASSWKQVGRRAPVLGLHRTGCDLRGQKTYYMTDSMISNETHGRLAASVWTDAQDHFENAHSQGLVRCHGNACLRVARVSHANLAPHSFDSSETRY